jgi:hypothetical protein
LGLGNYKGNQTMKSFGKFFTKKKSALPKKIAGCPTGSHARNPRRHKLSKHARFLRINATDLLFDLSDFDLPAASCTAL